MASSKQTEPFPEFIPLAAISNPSQDDGSEPTNRSNDLQISPSTAGRSRQSRGQSLIHNILTGDTPLGVWQAIGEAGSKIPTLSEIHDGSFGDEGWSKEGQLQRRGTDPCEIHQSTSRAGRGSVTTRREGTGAVKLESAHSPSYPSFPQERSSVDAKAGDRQPCNTKSHSSVGTNMRISVDIVDIGPRSEGPDKDGFYPNGYRFPEKHTWRQSISIALKAFWKFFITLKGFLFTIYCLNVVGWGAMIFFVLLNAAPAMCHPSCNDKYSPRNVWIEIDAQILTALFCVPAFGLIPRRFRDFSLLIKWRLGKDTDSHRRLAGIYRSWYRLPGSNMLAPTIGPPSSDNRDHTQLVTNPDMYSTEYLGRLMDNTSLPLPPQKIPDAPLTGVRAPPTKSWNLDIVIWMYMLNTWIQGALCGIMWGMNRFNRPSWATGLLISIGCITGIVGGVVEFTRGSKVKKVEGIPVDKEFDVEKIVEKYRMTSEQDAKASEQQIKQVQADGMSV